MCRNKFGWRASFFRGLFFSVFFLITGLFPDILTAQQKENFFWDSVESLSQKNSYFPLALNDAHNAYVFFESADKIKQEIKISWRHKKDSLDWSDTFSLDSAFKYSGENVPDMYSAALSNDGLVAVSVLDSSSMKGLVKVYSSADESQTFSEFTFPSQKNQITSSRIFPRVNGGFILFISLGEGKQSPTESSFSVLYAESSDGKYWSPLKVFGPSATISNAFSPFYASIADKEFVFFEGWHGKDSTTSLIYSSSRPISGGEDWSEPFVVTGQSSMTDTSSSYLDFKNFRPFVLSAGSETKIAWERSSKIGRDATVMVAPLSAEGKILDKNDVEALNAFGNARRPSLFFFNKKFFALWFDDRSGVNNVHLSENLGIQWIEVDSFLRRQNQKNPCSFPAAFIQPGSSALTFVWQEEKSSAFSISSLSEDFSVNKPTFEARNFKLGRRGNKMNPSIRIVFPDDISGIEAWSGIWTSDKEAEPSIDRYGPDCYPPSERILSGSVTADSEEDEILYFKARVMDRAGNWSQTAVAEYYFDRTPPKKPLDISYEKDEWGFAVSNDLAFTWHNDDGDDDIAGYAWSLTRVAPLERSLWVSKTKKISLSADECQEKLAGLVSKNEANIQKAKAPGQKIASEKALARFRNRDNGLYVFSVRAIDSVGNDGPAEQCLVFLNKYKAATLIKNVIAKSDDLGNVSVSVLGDEFMYDGEISQVILTKKSSGEKFVFKKADGDYVVEKNKAGGDRITGIKIDGMKAGSYTVQLRHSERGLSSWSRNLVIEESGTVKYEKQYNFEPVWKLLPAIEKKYDIDTQNILYWLFLMLILFGIIVCMRGVLSAAGDLIRVKKDVSSILTGDYMSNIDIDEMDAGLKVRVSLRLKFGLAITSLLLMIVAGVAFAIGYRMSGTQERILISGLKDRVKTVMGNMASGVQSYLDDGRDKLVEIGAIVNQTDNFLEAKCATILSYEIDGKALNDSSRPLDYVWASNDENIVRKINSINFDAGTVRFAMADTFYADRCVEINEGAAKIVQNFVNTTGDYSSLVFRKLNEYSATQYGSYPEMSDEKLDRNIMEYYFYWPVIYQKGQDKEHFLQAMILMEVSTNTLVEQIDASKRMVMSIAAIAAILAAAIALVSAFILSSIIVSPIRRIVSHVKKITETQNKLLLEGVEIRITSHDELRTLGDSVNEMTKGLVKGAKDEERAKLAFQRAAKDRERAARAQAEEAKARAESAEMSIMNMDGQAVQKAFIPLVSAGAEKATVAELKEKEIQVFGYYEGTDAVSGDYFDYKKLDDRWYAFIKCDASGHGVPAALIMTIVATIFRRYFSSWKFEKNGVKLNLLAADINDFIESLGLRGKFAAMMICLLDTKTGDVYICNAGDNILHVFDSLEKKIKVITLHEAPAAGPLPSFLVDMKGGYKVEKIKLKKDDVLFLYTDGIEESTRFFRNADFEIIACDEKNLKAGEVHGTHKKGEKSEQMEPQRVKDVIEAVLNRKKYVLERYHSPVKGERLEFDFSICEGSIEEAVIALTAVEKVFRMYKKKNSEGRVEKTEMNLDGKNKTVIQIFGDGIKIDRKIDLFLKKHFNLYDYYCVNRVDAGESNYVYYTGVNEDVQADDLTLLAIKKV